MSSDGGVEAGDAVSTELTAVLARLGELAAEPVDDASVPGRVGIDRIAALEQMRSALAAAQHTEMVAFGRSQVEEQADVILETIGTALKERYGVADVLIVKKEFFSKPAAPQLIDALSQKIDVAVAAVGG